MLPQVLKVLKVLHEEGYAHRNIKPSNILHSEKLSKWSLSDFAASCPFRTLLRPFDLSCLLGCQMIT